MLPPRRQKQWKGRLLFNQDINSMWYIYRLTKLIYENGCIKTYVIYDQNQGT